MSRRVWLPFVLTGLIGGVTGMQLLQEAEDADTSAKARLSVVGPPSPARQDDAAGVGERAATPMFSDVIDIPQGGSPAHPPHVLEAAFRAVLREPAGEARLQKLQAAYERWVLEDPALALSKLDLLPAEERQGIFANALALLARQRPERFRIYIDSIGQDASGVLEVTLTAVAEKNVREALAWLQQNPGRDPQGALIGAVLPHLIRADLPLAAKTVATMETQASLALIQQVATALARHDPAHAYEWVGTMVKHTDKQPSQVMDEVSASLVADDPAAAANALARSSDPSIRQSLMGALAMQKAQDDLPNAWNWLAQYNADPAYADVALNFLYRWSYVKPQEVAKVVPLIGDAQMQAAAATHLARFWQQGDRVGYQSWVATLPAGLTRDAALGAQ